MARGTGRSSRSKRYRGHRGSGIRPARVVGDEVLRVPVSSHEHGCSRAHGRGHNRPRFRRGLRAAAERGTTAHRLQRHQARESEPLTLLWTGAGPYRAVREHAARARLSAAGRYRGIKPNLFAIGLGRPFSIAEHWQLGARGYFQFGTLEGDITCGEDEVAAGDDPDRNPFMCEAPSNDKLGQKVYGAELTAGYISDGKFRPYAGLAFNYLDLDFQVDALYAGLIDTTEQFTDGGTISVTAGANYIATDKWRITGEVFYTWLSVVRPPSMTSGNDGLLNFRVLVSYRIR